MDYTFPVAIVIPFYRDALTAYEQIALIQCQKILSAYPKIAIKPNHIVLSDDVKKFNFIDIISFDDKYFEGIQGYNSLMLSEQFYGNFLKYEYILIYQLDAFVFKDDLKYWCSQGYDYIGAPWIRKKDDNKLKLFFYPLLFTIYTRFNITKKQLPSKKQFDNKVGNGGFSLRRVAKFHLLSKSIHSKMSKYLNRSETEFNEDAFWSIEVNRKKKIMNIPSYKIGLKFSIENAPYRALKLNNYQLPFGCHAWHKHLGFWRPIFRENGYSI